MIIGSGSATDTANKHQPAPNHTSFGGGCSGWWVVSSLLRQPPMVKRLPIISRPCTERHGGARGAGGGGGGGGNSANGTVWALDVPPRPASARSLHDLTEPSRQVTGAAMCRVRWLTAKRARRARSRRCVTANPPAAVGPPLCRMTRPVHIGRTGRKIGPPGCAIFGHGAPRAGVRLPSLRQRRDSDQCRVRMHSLAGPYSQ